MTFSALDFISQALRLLGVLNEGGTANGAQGADGLIVLNQLLDLWGIDGNVSILSILRTAFPCVANQQRYTVGPGADWVLPERPAWIDRARVIPDTSLAAASQDELPVFLHTASTWAAKVLKNQTNTYPVELYFDKSFNRTTARGNIDLAPIPTSALASIVLYTPTVLAQFADLATDYEFPQGYPAAIVPNLAVALGPYFGRVTRAKMELILAEAARTKAIIETINFTVPVMRADSALLGRGGGFDTRAGR